MRTKVIFFGSLFLCMLCCSGCREEESRYTITMMTELFPSYEDSDGGQWLEDIEAFGNVSLEIQMIPTLEYVSQMESRIRSSSLPMVVTVNESVLESQSFHACVADGGFWKIEDYLDEYPFLKAFVEDEVWENSRINGHIYGIPRLRVRPRYTAYYRIDWAESLGIESPETLEEIYYMLKAFKEQDPDGNGKDDTIGLVDSWQAWGNRKWNGIQTITTALGGPNGWMYDSEKEVMVPDFSTVEYTDTLLWLQRLYREEILNQSFSFLTPVQRQELFVQGKAGMIFSVIDDGPLLADWLYQMDPQAEVGILPVIKSETSDELRVNSTIGFNGMILFNRSGKNAVKNEEELREILSFYDRMCTEEGQEILAFVSAEQSAEAGSCVQLMPLPSCNGVNGDEELQQVVYEQIEEREKWLVEDDSYSLYSETYARFGEDLNEIIQKASIRFIMGELTQEDYRREYEEWYDSGGEAVIREYTEAYQMK